jgi:ABC-type uncharacterized transport system permease subunit
MKSLNLKENIYFLLTCLVFLVLSLLALNTATAQESIPNPADIINDVKNVTSWADLLGIEAVIYTFIITVGGWLSSFIPGLRSIDSGTYRVLVFAILVICGSLVIGVGNVWVGAISYFFSTSLYEVVLKWIVKSPKPSEIEA